MFYAVAFDPITIFLSWALDSDSQNISFVKAINVVG